MSFGHLVCMELTIISLTTQLINMQLEDRTPNIKKNEDGSFDIYIQHESPGAEREDNWLPCPEKEFYMILRAYGPDESIIEQTCNLPVIEVVK